MTPLYRCLLGCCLAFLLTSCGGGGGGGSVTSPPTPPPSQPTRLQITTTSVPSATAGQSYTTTLTATGGTAPYVWSITNGELASGLTLTTQSSSGVIAGTPMQAGSCTFTAQVQDSGSQSASQAYSLSVTGGTPSSPPPISILTTAFYPAVVSHPYLQTLNATGGTPPYSWSIALPGPPSGLHLDSSSGEISGIATVPGASYLVVTVRDSSYPQLSAVADLSLLVILSPGMRNDALGAATQLPYNGTSLSFIATLSPYSDPDVTTPDVDHYKVTAAGGSVIVVETALPNDVETPVDTVIEIVDGSGQRLTSCRDLADDNPPAGSVVPDATPQAFDDPCMNDDRELGGGPFSYLEFQVPGASKINTTFYIRVFDWRGDARPDFLYQLILRPR